MTPPFATDSKAFAAKLKSARLRTGKSQEQVALEVGTSRRHYIRWENGSHVPSHPYVVKLAAATRQSVAYFADEAQRERQEADADSEGRQVLTLDPAMLDAFAMLGDLIEGARNAKARARKVAA